MGWRSTLQQGLAAGDAGLPICWAISHLLPDIPAELIPQVFDVVEVRDAVDDDKRRFAHCWDAAHTITLPSPNFFTLPTPQSTHRSPGRRQTLTLLSNFLRLMGKENRFIATSPGSIASVYDTSAYGHDGRRQSLPVRFTIPQVGCVDGSWFLISLQTVWYTELLTGCLFWTPTPRPVFNFPKFKKFVRNLAWYGTCAHPNRAIWKSFNTFHPLKKILHHWHFMQDMHCHVPGHCSKRFVTNYHVTFTSRRRITLRVLS